MRAPLAADAILGKVYRRLVLIHATATAQTADGVILDEGEVAAAIAEAAADAMALLDPLRNPGLDYSQGGGR